jgi:hypothetical protein
MALKSASVMTSASSSGASMPWRRLTLGDEARSRTGPADLWTGLSRPCAVTESACALDVSATLPGRTSRAWMRKNGRSDLGRRGAMQPSSV